MDFDKKNLAAGIREMRSVAARLTAWADDLEKSVGKADGTVAEDAAPADVPASVSACDVPAVPVPEPKPVTRASVKNLLTKKCAAGYAAQVKALIASFGVTSLSAVPDASLGELWDAALLLGEEDADSPEGDAHAV